MSYDEAMTTKEALAKLVRTVSTSALAKAAGVSTKTIYRIRDCKANPSLETVQGIEAAVKALSKMRQAPGKAAAAKQDA